MLDVSSKHQVKQSSFWIKDIDQLYHPTGDIGQDFQDLVYSFDNINVTKFVPILLKEWFFLIKKNGYLIIDYQPNERCDFQKLEEQMWWLWKGKYEIIFHGQIGKKDLRNLTEEKLKEFIATRENYYRTDLDKESQLPSPLATQSQPASKNGYLRFVCKKTESTLIPGDHITKWTFGIITNGKRIDWMEKIIQSIRAQKIPDYEIVICGSYYDRKEKDVRYIPFNQRDEKGWITKKKNLIVANAKYENMCIIHDRIVFDKDWYKGMKKWGNCFEHLSCQQLFQEKRAGDWCIVEDKYLIFNGEKSYFVSSLDYKDWYRNSFISGTMHIGKKSFFVSTWNEALYWNQAEDYVLSKTLSDRGLIPRFVNTAKVTSLVWRFMLDTLVPYNNLKDTKERKAPISKIIGRNGMYYTNRLLQSDKLVAFAWKFFFESKLFKK